MLAYYKHAVEVHLKNIDGAVWVNLVDVAVAIGMTNMGVVIPLIFETIEPEHIRNVMNNYKYAHETYVDTIGLVAFVGRAPAKGSLQFIKWFFNQVKYLPDSFYEVKNGE